MPLIVAEVDSESDYDQICPLDHDAWKKPYNPQLKHFRPYIADRDEAIANQKQKCIGEWKERDSKNFYIKAVDTDAHEIIGYAIWKVNDSPEPYGEPTVASWHPEGSDEKEFAERFINGLWGFIDLLSITVHTEHRHRGAGRLLVRWGTAKADELGIETVVSSLPSARGAYEKSGLGCIEVIPADESLKVEDPSPKWRELLEDDLSGYLMWRPIGHDYVDGVDKAPWLSIVAT